MPPKKIKAEWTLNGKKDFKVPENAIGFTYRIDIVGTDLYYWGRKNLKSYSGRGKKRIEKDSNWKIYESSSKEIKQLIKEGAIIEKQIIEFAFSKAELSLLETQLIICGNSLQDENCLNRWVNLKVWEHQLKSK